MQQNKARKKIWYQDLEALGKKYEDHDYYNNIFLEFSWHRTMEKIALQIYEIRADTSCSCCVCLCSETKTSLKIM